MRTSERGFTLVEIATILLTLAVLAAILLPEIEVFVDKAKIIRAREDVASIGIAIERYLNDVGECAVWENSNGNTGVGASAAAESTAGPSRQAETNRVDLLIGDGDIPDTSPTVPFRASNNAFVADTTVSRWRTQCTSLGVTTVGGGGVCESISNILLTNSPAQDPGRHARFIGNMSLSDNYDPDVNQQFNQAFGWKGPYLSEATADPWGNRYAVNSEFKDCVNGDNASPANDGTDGTDNDVFVLSAGPNEMVNTPWTTRALSPDGALATKGGTDDDVFFVLSGASTRR